MRKITEQSTRAFLTGQTFHAANMDVAQNAGDNRDESHMYLHGNLIAVLTATTLTLLDAGWQTVTTKERLNGILTMLGREFGWPDYGVFQSKHVWYLHTPVEDLEWNGTHTFTRDGSEVLSHPMHDLAYPASADVETLAECIQRICTNLPDVDGAIC